MDIQGMTTPKPVKMHGTTTTGLVHKEVQGRISRTHNMEGNYAYNSNFANEPFIKKLVLGQAKIYEILTQETCL
jgi:hypothetical protein